MILRATVSSTLTSSQFKSLREIPLEYCHLTLHLPVRTDDHKLAANEIMDELKNQHNGSTYVDVEKTDFTGTWFNEFNELVEEEVTIFMVDLPYNYLLQRNDILDKIKTIKDRTFELYENNNVRQDEIWLTASPMIVVQRITLSS